MNPPIYRVVGTHATYSNHVTRLYENRGAARGVRTRLQNRSDDFGLGYSYVVQQATPDWKVDKA